MTKNYSKKKLTWKSSTHRLQNQQFRMAGLDCYATGGKRFRIKRTMSLNLDQGQTSACTGFACGHTLASSLGAQTDVDMTLAKAIYLQAQREDEWAGENYDGSSVNGAMHAARTLGRIKSWRWASTPEEVQHGLSYHGSAEAGSVWLSGMFDPHEDGYLYAVGDEVGGHAYCISGFRPASSRGAKAVDYWIDNSWGPDWGVEGGAWIADDYAHTLWFENGGEIAFPVK